MVFEDEQKLHIPPNSNSSKIIQCVLVAQSCPTLCNPMDWARRASLSLGYSRQEYWSGLSFPSPGDLPDPGIEPWSPTLQADSLPFEPPGKPYYLSSLIICIVILYALNFYRKYCKEKKHSKYSNSFLKNIFHCIIQNYLYRASHGNISMKLC